MRHNRYLSIRKHSWKRVFFSWNRQF